MSQRVTQLAPQTEQDPKCLEVAACQWPSNVTCVTYHQKHMTGRSNNIRRCAPTGPLCWKWRCLLQNLFCLPKSTQTYSWPKAKLTHLLMTKHFLGGEGWECWPILWSAPLPEQATPRCTIMSVCELREGNQQAFVCLRKCKFPRVSGGLVSVSHVSLETCSFRKLLPSLLLLGSEVLCLVFLCSFSSSHTSKSKNVVSPILQRGS